MNIDVEDDVYDDDWRPTWGYDWTAKDDEQAIYIPGQGTKIISSNEENLRNLDEVILESCRIKKPHYRIRARSLCSDFSYFDKDLEVFSDEEGDNKCINGYPIGR